MLNPKIKSEVEMPFCVVKSSALKYVLAVILVAIMLSISINGATSAQVFFGYSTRKVPIYAVETDKKQVAISFDAAWGADKTEDIIETLAEYNATATFFLVGFWVDKFPEMVQKINSAGLEIGSHSNTHPDLTTLSNEMLKQELVECNKRITEITSKPVEVFRCPYGSYNNNVLEAIEAENMLPIQWDVDSLDWKGISAQEITTRIVSKVKNGSIILCHNNADNIVEALVMVLDRLTGQGYKITSVGELVLHQDFYVDRNGIQHKN